MSGIGGAVTVTGDRMDPLVFDSEVIGDRYAVVGRWYPVMLEGANGTDSFESVSSLVEKSLVCVELAGGLTGKPAVTCQPSYRVLSELSRQVTDAEITVDYLSLAM